MSATTLSDRACLRLSGPDVRGFLQGLVTNDVAGDLPVWAALLSAQGKALFDFLVWADGEDLILDCEAAQAEALARRLTLYRLRRPITIARDEALAVHWAADGQEGVPDPRLAALGRRWIAPSETSGGGGIAPSETSEGGGIAPPGEAATGWRAHRLSLGVTEGVAELGLEKTLWLEANAAELHGVSFTKGCYVGQENTARMNWRQKVNRRLVVRRVANDPGEGPMAYYPELGLAVLRARVETLAEDGELIRPDWLRAAIEQTGSPDE